MIHHFSMDACSVVLSLSFSLALYLFLQVSLCDPVVVGDRVQEKMKQSKNCIKSYLQKIRWQKSLCSHLSTCALSNRMSYSVSCGCFLWAIKGEFSKNVYTLPFICNMRCTTKLLLPPRMSCFCFNHRNT